MGYKSKTTSSYKIPESFYHDYNQAMYDNLPYHRDTDLCNPQYLIDHRSCVIRIYRYDTEPRNINTTHALV